MNTTSRRRPVGGLTTEFPRTGPASSPDRAGDAGAERPPSGLLVRATAADRVRRHLAEAEMLFVARVVQDGGVHLWRMHVRDRFLAARRALEHNGRISRTETADLVVSLVDQHVRDWCWLEVETAPEPAWSALWMHLVQHALSPFRTEPLFLLGWTAWRRHDGTLARAATTAARAEEPGHDAARMLEELLDRDVSPSQLPSLAEWRPGPKASP